MRHEAGTSLSLLNSALLVVLLGLTVLHWGLRANHQERGVELFPNMAHAVSAESFSANPVLAGGMTLQPPAAGTIARGWLPLHLEATPEDAVRAGEILESPFSLDDRAAMARGQAIYGRFCVLCHGPGGDGDGTVAQRGFPAPPSLLAPNARQMRDGQIFHVVTFGQGNMPSHAAQLDRDDRWCAVLRVRELQRAAGPLPDPALVDETATTTTAAVATPDGLAAGGQP